MSDDPDDSNSLIIRKLPWVLESECKPATMHGTTLNRSVDTVPNLFPLQLYIYSKTSEERTLRGQDSSPLMRGRPSLGGWLASHTPKF